MNDKGFAEDLDKIEVSEENYHKRKLSYKEILPMNISTVKLICLCFCPFFYKRKYPEKTILHPSDELP